VTALWQAAVDASPPLGRWLERQGARLRIGRLPRAAWPIVAASIARDLTARGRPVLVLVPAPERFAGDLRPWLAGRPPIHVFAEVAVSFLDRPPAFDEAVSLRLEALAALAGAGRDPAVVVSSRRAALRATISPADLAAGTVELEPGVGPDPVTVASRLTELGYSREALVEEPGQFSLRGGILDVFPAGADAPARAEWLGDTVDTLRMFDPTNQRSVMGLGRLVVRTGRELMIGPERTTSRSPDPHGAGHPGASLRRACGLGRRPGAAGVGRDVPGCRVLRRLPGKRQAVAVRSSARPGSGGRLRAAAAADRRARHRRRHHDAGSG